MAARFLRDPDFRTGCAEMLPACVALIPFGLVCGVGSASAGIDLWASFGLSAIVFSGAAQVLAVQLLVAGAPVLVIVLTCFVAGLRLVMYSAAIAPHVRELPPRWQQGLAFLLTDQTFAMALRRYHAGVTPKAGALRYLGGGSVLWLGWQLTNLVGYFAGNVIPASWSLDFAVPLCFVALVAPLLRDMPNIAAAAVAAIAVVAFGAMPMKLNLIAAGALGILVGTLIDYGRNRWTRR